RQYQRRARRRQGSEGSWARRSSFPPPPAAGSGRAARSACWQRRTLPRAQGFFVVFGLGGNTAGVAFGDGVALGDGVGFGFGSASARIWSIEGPPGSGAVGGMSRCASEY